MWWGWKKRCGEDGKGAWWEWEMRGGGDVVDGESNNVFISMQDGSWVNTALLIASYSLLFPGGNHDMCPPSPHPLQQDLM